VASLDGQRGPIHSKSLSVEVGRRYYSFRPVEAVRRPIVA